MAQQWNTIKHKFTAEEHAAVKKEAHAELERIGFGKLRQARQQTQVAVAGRLRIPQGAVSRLEKRSDVLLSTLREYVGALGGRLELRAVFPDGDFELDTLGVTAPIKKRAARSTRRTAKAISASR